jgi:hypothetical protein
MALSSNFKENFILCCIVVFFAGIIASVIINHQGTRKLITCSMDGVATFRQENIREVFMSEGATSLYFYEMGSSDETVYKLHEGEVCKVSRYKIN